MSSRIAELQAQMGGGAMIIGGMRPGAVRSIPKSKQLQKRTSLDHTPLLNRTVLSKGDRKKKKTSINFDKLQDDHQTDYNFQESMSSNIHIKPITSSTSTTFAKKQTQIMDKNTSKIPLNTNTKSNKRSSYTEREEKLIDIVSTKNNSYHIRLYSQFDNYAAFRKGEKGKGLHIESFCDNKYGKAIESTGINIGWKLVKISQNDVSKLKLFIIKNQLQHEARQSGTKGYDVTFEEAILSTNIDIETQTETKSETVEPIRRSGLKCELIKTEKGLRVLRLFATFDKYIETKEGANGKGMVVTGFVDYYIKDLGVDIGWKLSKLGKKNVTKTSFVMLRNQLLAQSCIAKDGYEITFVDIMRQKNIIQKKARNIVKSNELNEVEIEVKEKVSNERRQSSCEIKKVTRKKKRVIEEKQEITPEALDVDESNNPQPLWCYWYNLCWQ